MKAFLISIFFLFPFLSFSQVDTIRIEEDSISDDIFQTKYDELTELIEHDSSDVDALLDRADLISGMNDESRFFIVFGNMEIYNQALEDYDKAIELSPYTFRPYYKRARLKDRFLFFNEALEDYDEAYTYAWGRNSKSKIKVRRARIKSKLGFKDIAVKELEKALLEDAENIGVMNMLALIHMDLEHYSESLNYLNRSLDVAPDDATTLSNIGFVALNSGKYKQAIKIYDTQLKTDSSDYIMLSNRGLSKYKLGEIDGALEDINKAIRLNPINAYALKNRAVINFELGNEEAGCADLQKAKDCGYTILFGDEVIKTLFDKCFSVNRKPQK